MSHVIQFTELSNLELIGQGGFGTVYKARDANWDTVVYKKLDVDNESLRQFINEALIHASSKHSNVVKLLGVVCDDGNCGLVMEYMPNSDLEDYLRENDVTYDEKLRLLTEVASAMRYLHNLKPVVIHGDLKIRNILISDMKVAKITNFGLSKQISQSTATGFDQRGTITNIPPEYLKDPYLRMVGAYDVYGFGILIFEVLTQEPPYPDTETIIYVKVQAGHRPDLAILPNCVSEELKKLVESCWHQAAHRRPNFTEIVQHLLVWRRKKTEQQFFVCESIYNQDQLFRYREKWSVCWKAVGF